MTKTYWFGALALLAIGCSAATDGPPAPDEGVSQSERRDLHLGKGPPPGSCQAQWGSKKYCGGKSKNGSCWCDAACVTYGDCCADKKAVCEPTSTTCGGFANLPCPDGKVCVDDPNDGCDPNNGGADCGGICVDDVPVGGECAADLCGPAPGMPTKLCPDGKNVPGPTGKCLKNDDGTCGWEIAECPPSGAFCGGFAGIQCPAGQECVDVPGDGCDPKNGGADCGGMCVDAPPATNSCAGHCGGVSADKSCYCDSVCKYYGDCCDDYAAQCTTRVPATGACVKNSNDSCTTDADCVGGGCGGELCYNPAVSSGISTCECTQPMNVGGCGCVQGKCTWYQ